MEDLHTLIRQLKKSEIQTIRSSLSCYSSRKQRETLSLYLFEFLLRSGDRIPSDDECAEELGTSRQHANYKMLKRRLKQKVLDALVLDINIQRAEHLDELDQVSLIVRKKIIQYIYLFRSKGRTPIMYNLLDEIIKLSKRYELYAPLVESLQYKKSHATFIKGIKAFNKINNEILFYEKCNQAVYKSFDYYYKLILRNDFLGKVDKKAFMRQINDAIVELNEDYRSTKSSRLMWNLKQIEMEYFLQGENNLAARDIGYEMLQIVKNNSAIYQRQRIGIIYDDIANCDILLGEYDKAIENVKLAQRYFTSSSDNFNASKVVEFYAYFYSGRTDQAGLVVSRLLKTDQASKGFRDAKFILFNAAVKFKKAQYKAVILAINELQELTQDKLGWNIAVRLLCIMTYVETGKYHNAYLQVDSLRKHLKRYSRKPELRKRDFEILRFLLMVGYNEFKKDSLGDTELEILARLSGDESDYKWEMYSPELIPFQQWAISYFDTKGAFQKYLEEHPLPEKSSVKKKKEYINRK